MTTLERARRAVFLAACFSLLASCGGGGGDDDDDEPEPPEEEDATGLWRGTYGGTPNRMQAMVAPDGSFVAIILPSSATANDARLLSGVGNVTAPDIINATGTTYSLGAALPNGSTTAPMTIAAGRVTEGVSLTGNYNAGGEAASFSLSFLPQSTRTPSFATLAGVYNLFPAPTNGTTATMTVRTDGTATFNHSNGCVGNGTFTILDPAFNMYRWSLSIANCSNGVANHSSAGIAALLDSPAGGTSNLLVMNGTATGAPLPWWIFNGTKP